MPKPRINKEDDWLPSRVYRGKSSYEWRPPGGYQPLLKIQRNPDGSIFEPPEVKRAVLEAWETAISIQSQQKNVDYWLTKFFVNRRFLKLDNSTQSDYRRYSDIRVRKGDPTSHDGVRYVFGDMMPNRVEPYHIRRYMDSWAAKGKEPTANRHLSFLQTFFGWVRQQNAGVRFNPAHGITKFKETPRKVYINDEQYNLMLEAAARSNTPYVAAIMEVAYLCGMRKHEVLRLNIEDITPKGVRFARGKGSKGEYTEISPRLQRALDVAVSINHDGVEPLKNRPLFRSLKRSRVSRSALDKAWRKIRKEADIQDFTIHY